MIQSLICQCSCIFHIGCLCQCTSLAGYKLAKLGKSLAKHLIFWRRCVAKALCWEWSLACAGLMGNCLTRPHSWCPTGRVCMCSHCSPSGEHLMCILKQHLLVCSELEDLGAVGLFVYIYIILVLHMHWKSVLLKMQQV